MEKVPMTPEGHAALTEELNHLKSVERPKISKEIGVAREHGDLRENAEYHAAKEKQGMIEARINEIEDKLSRAEVIDPSSFTGDKVRFGAHVTMEDVDSGKVVEYRIVGPDEADLEKGTISVTSPVARALIGREPGDEVTVNAPGGKKTYEITKVRWR
ncbi:transcription elongation factor GreA [Sandaracinus amylolyticus]|uniref:Transcription elongation factor GreA n=1 Tax=Sandaracinus amylolyticus TaxID=927083 RepID=A0A0F6W467_9BACT|nr:transcription elongation factor GreA [Sandaracinus amylolyticus]AKF07050.1 Transcription elongation factor GreA [Sandaracinus amylolyticus]